MDFSATLVVEDGTGLSAANAYVSLEEAEIFIAHIPDVYKSVWLTADDFVKSQVIIWATSLLDQYVYFPPRQYRNIRKHRTQALNFPRAGLVDQDGFYIDDRLVPMFMKDATVQMALALLRSDLTLEPQRGILSAKVGSLAVQFDPNQSHLPRVIPRTIALIFARYGGVVRGYTGIRSYNLYRA